MSQPVDPDPATGPVQPAAQPWQLPADPPHPPAAASGDGYPQRRPVANAVVMLAVAAAVAGLGAPFGLLWSVVAPDVPVRVTDQGPAYGQAQPEQLVAADGWFAILAVPFGVLVAAALWRLVRSARGTPGLVALTIGALGAGLLAWWLGRQVGLADYQTTLAAAETGAQFGRPADLGVAEVGWWPPRVLGVLVVPALAAAATYTMLAAWSPFPSLQSPGANHPARPPAAADLDHP